MGYYHLPYASFIRIIILIPKLKLFLKFYTCQKRQVYLKNDYLDNQISRSFSPKNNFQIQLFSSPLLQFTTETFRFPPNKNKKPRSLFFSHAFPENPGDHINEKNVLVRSPQPILKSALGQ